MSQSFQQMIDTLNSSRIKGFMDEIYIDNQELNLVVQADNLLKVAEFLKTDKRFQCQVLVSICGVDYPSRQPRFEVVYQLLSLTHNHRLRLKVRVNEDQQIPSLIELYPSANWYERETWDMYGIAFANHPDLRRILTDYGFEGHPFRKDFPLSGHVEVKYDDVKQKVVYDKVHLAQEYRNFDAVSPWENPNYILPGDEKAK